jgi:hypothetical protein
MIGIEIAPVRRLVVEESRGSRVALGHDLALPRASALVAAILAREDVLTGPK